MTTTMGLSRLLLTFFVLLLVRDISAQNLIANGSFTNIGADWISAPPAIGTEAYLAETSYGGTAGTNIVAEIDNECNLRQTGITVVPGTTYWFSFRRTRRTTGGAPNPTAFNVKVYDGNGSYIDQVITSSNFSWNWQCETFQFTPGSNMVSIDFINITASTLGTIIDDVTITPVMQPLQLAGTACQGGNIELTAPVFPGNPNAVYTNYSWTGPNGFTATGPTIMFNNAQPVLNGTYTCTMSLNECLTVTGTYQLMVTPSTINLVEDICDGSIYDFYGRLLHASGTYDTLIKNSSDACETLVTLQLNVNPIPDMATEPTGDVAICKGDTLKLQLKHPSELNAYQWLKDGLVINGETSGIYSVYATGQYRVRGISDKGCIDTSSVINLTVHELPLARINYKINGTVCMNDTIRFTSEHDALYYRWSPEVIFRSTSGTDGKVALGILKHELSEIVLTVYNSVGCFSSDTVNIKAVSCCQIFTPNAFSPNADGINDYFMPVLKQGQLIISFQVFDRWGKVVCSNLSGHLLGWDGQYENGNIADGGVYNYLIYYSCDGHANETIRGEVTLLR